MEGIFELSRRARDKGYLIFVVTNQAGIGRGFFSVADFETLTEWMIEKFCNEGVRLSKVYYCPFHPTHGVGKYRRDDECRKPKPGMIKRAEKEFMIDLSRSILIGDRLTDIQAGINAGIQTNVLYQTDLTIDAGSDLQYFSVSNLYQASLYLQK